MAVTSILFYVFSVIVLVSAAKVALSTNLVHSALFLVLTFFGVSCIYILLGADFLAVVQILIYIGAVSVLLVFGVMLTKRGDMSKSSVFNRFKLSGLIAGGALLAVMIYSVFASRWETVAAGAPMNTVERIADMMMDDYVIPFEAAGILLLVALIGAIFIGKGVKGRK